MATTVGELVARLKLKGGNEFVNKYKRITRRIKGQLESLNSTSAGLKDFNAEYRKTGGLINRLNRSINNLSIRRDRANNPAKIKRYNQLIGIQQKKISKLNMTTNRFSAGITNLQHSWMQLSMVVAGAAFAINGLVNSYAGFDNRIREIGTLLDDVTEKSLKKMSREVKMMAVQFGQSLDTMAKARYDIISAGFTDAADSANILAEASKLAVGGVSTVAQTALSLTKMLNSFKLSATEAGSASDIMFTTVRLGQTTIDQLVGVLGHVNAIANKAKLGLKGLGASMAALTAGGLNTEIAAVALRGALLALDAPTQGAARAMEKAGISVKHFNDGTMDIVETIRQFEGMDLKSLNEFIPDVRAANAVAVLSNNVDKLAAAVKAMETSSGAADAAFAKMAKGAKFRIDQMKARFSSAATEMGNGLLPLYQVTLGFVELLAQMPATLKIVLVNVVALTVALTTLRTVFTAFGLATGPIGWVIAGITALTGVLAAMAMETDDAAEANVKLAKSNEWVARSFKKISEQTIKEASGMSLDELKAKQKTLTKIIKDESRLQNETRERLKSAGSEESKKNYELAIQQSENLIALRQRELSEIISAINERKNREGAFENEDIASKAKYYDSLMEKQFEFQEISLNDYILYLKKRRDAQASDSQEFLDFDYKIKGLLRDQQVAHDDFLKDEIDQFNAKKKSAREKELLDQMSFYEQLGDLEMSLAFDNNEVSFESYVTYLEDKLAATEKFSVQYLQLWQKIQRLIIKNQEDTQKRLNNSWRGATQAMADFGTNIGAIIADKAMTGAKKWNEFGREVLFAIVDILEKKLLAAQLSSLIDGIINFATFAKNAPLIVAAQAGLAALRGTIASLAEGGVVSRPTLAVVGDRIVAGRNIPEVVAPIDKFETFAQQLANRVAPTEQTQRTDVIVNQNFNTPLQDKRMAKKMTDEVLRPQMTRAFKRGGKFVNRDPFKG
jgi:TP901 family phage tail tape measure protein